MVITWWGASALDFTTKGRKSSSRFDFGFWELGVDLEKIWPYRATASIEINAPFGGVVLLFHPKFDFIPLIPHLTARSAFSRSHLAFYARPKLHIPDFRKERSERLNSVTSTVFRSFVRG